MFSVQSVSFSVLINGSASTFFRPERGLRQGCPLAPLLFLLVVEGLSRAIIHAKDLGGLKCILIGGNVSLTHLLFVDDNILFTDGS